MNRKQTELKWETQGSAVVLENGGIIRMDGDGSATSHVILSQKAAMPVRISCESRSREVSGNNAWEYSVLAKLEFADGSSSRVDWFPFNDGSLFYPDYAPFPEGTHDFQLRSMLLACERPIRAMEIELLFTQHSGLAEFRNLKIEDYASGETLLFDTFPVTAPPPDGFSVTDPEIQIETSFSELETALFPALRRQVKLRLREGDRRRDHAFTVYYVTDADGDWFPSMDQALPTSAVKRDYFLTAPWHVGANGLASRVPFTAVGDGHALGFDPEYPLFGRVGFNSCFRKLFIAFDLALTEERPEAEFAFADFHFDPGLGFRGALSAYYALYPDYYRTRIRKQGNWMAFAPISALPDPEDFHFRFKETHPEKKETDWDAAHDILTFRYTEPMTGWMRMPAEADHSKEGIRAWRERHAPPESREIWDRAAMRDENGQDILIGINRPWCHGAVWSINSMPGLGDFEAKLGKNPGEYNEYIDSAEGYVTADISHRRDHFSKTRLPLSFASDSRLPGIWKGSIAFEYARALREILLPEGKYLMANGTPGVMWFLPPLLDVAGTETDWNPGGVWTPMTAEDFRYRRSACSAKPYCLLMNTDFTRFSAEMVEKYMKRCLAFGFFPSFFSADAATGHYFKNPALYERDRACFKRYLPFIRLVAEAGWEPLTEAETEDSAVLAERFGKEYLTLLNDSAEVRKCSVRFARHVSSVRDLLSGSVFPVKNSSEITLSLNPEDVALLQFKILEDASA